MVSIWEVTVVMDIQPVNILPIHRQSDPTVVVVAVPVPTVPAVHHQRSTNAKTWFLLQSGIIVVTASTALSTPVKESLIPQLERTVATAPITANVSIVLTPLFLIIPAIILTEAGIAMAISGTVVSIARIVRFRQLEHNAT